ncbi:MAG: hypothetical protein ABSG73_11095 [Candidatus Aminicenantales bacterium]|jgi:hypothetical protein
MDEKTQIGRPPDEEDKYWLEQANTITPEKSIERIDAHGKYLFSTVSIVGTLLTGFGLFSPSGSAVLRTPWLVVPVLFACLSLALAMMGITPRLDKVSRRDIISIRNHYNNLIRKRGRFVFWGGVFFSLSLLSVAIILPTSLNTSDFNPTISVRFMGGGEKAVLTTKVEFQRLPRSGMIETNIFGYSDLKEGIKPTILFRDISQANRSGNTTVAAEQDQIQSYKRFVINCRVKSAAKLLYEKTVEISH